MPASGLVVRRLLENLEIDWQRLHGPALNREEEVSRLDEGQGGPTLQDFNSNDLGSVPSLLALHRDSLARGLVTNSEDGLLSFLATAQRCLRRGRNPAALFRWLIEAGHLGQATIEDENLAHAAFKKYQRTCRPLFLKAKTVPPSVPKSAGYSEPPVV